MLGLGSFKVADVLVVVVGSPPLPRPVVRLAFARCLPLMNMPPLTAPSQSSPVQQHAAPSRDGGKALRQSRLRRTRTGRSIVDGLDGMQGQDAFEKTAVFQESSLYSS